MLVFLCVLILIISIPSLRIFIKTEGRFNLFVNNGFVRIRLFGFCIFEGKLHLESNDIKHNNLIIEHNNKRNEIHLNINRRDERSIVSILNQPIMRATSIEKLNIDINVGKANDVFFTYLALSGLKIALCSVLSYIKSQYTAEISESFKSDYNSDKLETDFSVIISISLYDIVHEYLINTRKKQNTVKKSFMQVNNIE